MDRFIRSMQGELDNVDGSLLMCHGDGVAYQIDQEYTVAYDAAYFDRCAGYEGEAIANAINGGRIAFVARYFGWTNKVCDVGIGSGEFIKRRGHTFGHDVNPVAIAWLKKNDLWVERDQLTNFGAFTFWDVIEHVPTPEEYFAAIKLHAYIFTSIPIFDKIEDVHLSKHYRPGEHLYYFTEAGFVGWMRMHGFRLLEASDFETQAGRESIRSFAFKRFRGPTVSS